MTKQITAFKNHLSSLEKSKATTEKYVRDVRAFAKWLDGRIPDKNAAIEYKQILTQHYKATSVNSMISSLNRFFDFINRNDLKLKALKFQRQLFAVTYYSKQKDVVRLADILGHASINTTRIYTIESGDTHRKHLDAWAGLGNGICSIKSSRADFFLRPLTPPYVPFGIRRFNPISKYVSDYCSSRYSSLSPAL